MSNLIGSKVIIDCSRFSVGRRRSVNFTSGNSTETLIQTAIFKRRKNFATQGLKKTSIYDYDITQNTFIWDFLYICLRPNQVFVFFSIYEKLIQYCGIDELGTNYPKVSEMLRPCLLKPKFYECLKHDALTFPQDMFDPHGWSEDSYYESLGILIYLS